VAALAGITIAAGGGGGLWAVHHAHEQWVTERMGTGSTVKLADASPVHTPRPFIASENGRQFNTDKMPFNDNVWIATFTAAHGNKGVLRRDDWQRAIIDNMPKSAATEYRRWYHGAGWDERLQKLGLLDTDNRFTPAAWAWFNAEVSPLPRPPGAPEVFTPGTNAERTPRTGDVLEW
jgi:hypothetical protein